MWRKFCSKLRIGYLREEVWIAGEGSLTSWQLEEKMGTLWLSRWKGVRKSYVGLIQQ